MPAAHCRLTAKVEGAVAKQPKKEGVRKTEKTVDRTPLLW